MSNQQVHGGQADGYYQNGQQDVNQGQYYQQQPQQGYQDPQYTQQPPQYNNKQQPRVQEGGGKQDFTQTFKLDKPKYNDIWAALLFIATFCGFVAVSGIAIQGYSATKLFQGGGIYGAPATVGLSTNTIILLYVSFLSMIVCGKTDDQ